MNESDFIWFPTEEIQQNSNLSRFIRYTDCKSFEQLRERSVSDPEWFWNAVSCFLNIKWQEPYTKIMNSAAGIPWTKWFLNGKVNISDNCLDNQLRNLHHKVALISEHESVKGKSLTYSELFSLTNQIAHALVHNLGVRRGDKVGLFMPMIAEAVAAFLAIIRIGAIVVPLFSGYGPESVSVRLSDCEAVTLITTESFQRRGKTVSMRETVNEAIRDIPSLKSVLVFGDGSNQSFEKISRGRVREFGWNIVEEADSPISPEKMDSEDPFMIIYTSGTTGKPKGAVHVHGGFLVKVAEEVGFQMDLRRDDTLFWFTDMGWIMAPWEIIGALSLGGTVLIYDGAPDYPKPD